MAHFQFKIKLRGISKPPVWRRIDVPEQATFEVFSQIIQDVFQWFGHHLWHFTPGGYGTRPIISTPLDIEFMDSPDLDARTTRLGDIFHQEGDKYVYIYDFGDDFIHDIILEKITTEESNKVYLRKAVGATPLEDNGGIMGHEQMKKAFTDHKSKEYREYCSMLGLELGEDWDFNDPEISCGEIGEIEIEAIIS